MDKLTKQAFTLIELLVVIAIIGILSGMIVISMGGVTDKATVAKAQVFSNSLRNSMMADLISEWKFDGLGISDGGTATTAYIQDTWGTNHGTTITGTPLVYSGNKCISGSCLYFDGLSTITGNSGNLIPSQAAYTIEGWVNIPSTATGGANRYLINLQTTTNLPGFSPCFSTAYKPLIYLNGSNYRYSNFDLRDNKWHHIAFIVTGSAITDINNSKTYVDGNLNPLSLLNSTVPLLPSGNFLIGGGSYIGYIDGIRIYDAAVSASQIQQQYYIGLNKLLNDGKISSGDYQNRMGELTIAER